MAGHLWTAVCALLTILMGFIQPGDGAKAFLQAGAPEVLPVKTIRVRGVNFSYVEQGHGEPVVQIGRASCRERVYVLV